MRLDSAYSRWSLPREDARCGATAHRLKTAVRRQNHAGMLASGTDPLRVKAIEIGDIERKEDTFAFGSERQLLLVGLLRQTGIYNRPL
jgi:hypothetical protein